MTQPIPVFYKPEQVAPIQPGSPSSEKPKYVVASWQDAGLPIEIRDFKPVATKELDYAHDPKYVRDVLSGKTHNGFGTKSPEVAASLPYTVGSFVAAARHACKTGRVAVSPTSGFHHAEYGSGGGFCTFNGLMVAAIDLLLSGTKTLAILDCDEHYGNGTDDVRDRLELRGAVQHYTRSYPGYERKSDPETFLRMLPKVLLAWKNAGVEIVLYQAGADPHVNDPMGEGYLTTEQMRRRDGIVFDTCRALGLPVAWNLAGGYQTVAGKTGADYVRPVLDLHDNTMRECARVYGEE